MPETTAQKIAEITDQYRAAGVNWRQWADSHGFRYNTVRDVIAGRSKCLRGETYRVAVALGALPPPPPELAHLSQPGATP